MSSFLQRALTLCANGYRVVPIQSGRKGPTVDGWQRTHADEKQIRKWASNGYANGNIGIITENTPAVDIDVYDPDVASQMELWLLREFGDTVVRVGRAPKRLLVYRADKPFPKMSVRYIDGDREHAIEILGAGQQFVAYGIHPDTKREYVWTSMDELVEIKTSDLPTLTQEQAGLILDHFEVLAKAKGWVRKDRSTGRADTENPFERYKPILAISEETVLDTLDYIPNDDVHYDDWLTVGCALHHQFQGSDRGLELWHEWGKGSSKYDASDTNRRWASFGHGPDTATFATLIYRANEAKKLESEKAFEVSLRRVGGCPDMKLLFGEVIKALAASATTDLQVDIACKHIQQRTHELTETKPRLETIRKQLAAARPRTEMQKRDVPKWCEPWVFVTRYGEFYNLQNGQALNRANFDAAFGRFLLDDVKRAAGESFGGKASDVALHLHEIPQVYDYIYMPGEGQFITVNRSMCVNTFSPSSVPTSKQPSTPDDYQAIRVVEKHFELLFPVPEERETVLDYLAYNVQFPSEKITWGMLIQGVDGAGKSWISRLMAACLGTENIRNVPGTALRETFTSWAEGRKMVFIEEIRLKDSDKFEIVEKLKPYITNLSAQVRRMRTDGYEIPNVTNYVLFTNYMDALPINNNDRRYFIIRTYFQTVSHIDKFNAENPDYFTNLFGALDFNGDVIRHWLLTRHISDNFRAKGKAPETEAKRMMRDAAESSNDNMRALEDALLEGDPLISNEVLSAKALREHSILGTMPPRAFSYLLNQAGFAIIGKFRIDGRDGDNVNYYTRHSELFTGRGFDDMQKIRELITPVDDGFGE